jgi:hypothetical protein
VIPAAPLPVGPGVRVRVNERRARFARSCRYGNRDLNRLGAVTVPVPTGGPDPGRGRRGGTLVMARHCIIMA